MTIHRIGLAVALCLALATLLGCGGSGSALGSDASALGDGSAADGTVGSDSGANDGSTAQGPDASGDGATSGPRIDGGSPGDGGAPTDGGAAAADAGGGDGAVPVTDAGPSPTDCLVRTTPACQPTAIGPRPAVDGGAGSTLTVVGRDVYWMELGPLTSSPVNLYRTNLDTGANMTVTQPSDALMQSEFDEPGTLLNDGTNVYLTSMRCCSGSTNPILEYAVGTSTWTTADGFVDNNLEGSVLAAGAIYSAYVGGIAERPLTNLASGIYRGVSSASILLGVDVIGTDGTRVYYGNAPGFSSFSIQRFDGDASTLLTTVDGGPGAFAPLMPVDDAYVYFYLGTTLQRVPKTAPGAAQTVIDATPHHPSLAVVDPWSLYWIDEAGLHVAPKAGGPAIDLAPVTQAAALDQTTDYVVWTSASGLTKLRK